MLGNNAFNMPVEATPSEARRNDQRERNEYKPHVLDARSPISSHDFEVDREGYSPYSKDPAHMRVPAQLPPPSVEGRYKDDQSPHSSKNHEHHRGCLMRGDDLSPRMAAADGPWVGQAPAPKEKYIPAEELPPRRTDSNASQDKLPAKSESAGWAANAERTPRSQAPHWANHRAEIEIEGYSSPRNAKEQARDELLEPDTLNPYRQHNDYISHPYDNAPCYEAAIFNAKNKYDVFYKDMSPLGDIRRKEPNPMSDEPVEEIVSPRHMQWDDNDHFIEHYYKYRAQKNLSEVDQDFDSRRNKAIVPNNQQFNPEVYKKKKNREVMKEVNEHGKHRAGYGLEGHSDDSEGEEEGWARGLQIDRNYDF